MTKRRFVELSDLLCLLLMCCKLPWSDTKIIRANIGLFIDEKDTERKQQLLHVVSNFTSNCYPTNTDCIKLDVDVIYLDEVPFSRIANIFCERVLKKQVVALVAHTTSVRTTQVIAFMASYLTIPIVGIATGHPLLSEKVGILAYYLDLFEKLERNR